MIGKLRHPLTASIIGSTLSVLACGLALNATSEIKDSRRKSIVISCNEGNVHHNEARVFIGQLAGKGPKPRTATEKKLQEEQLHLFLEAVAPYHDCAERVKKLTK